MHDYSGGYITECSGTAETGICTVPWGPARNICGTAPKHKLKQRIRQHRSEIMVHWHSDRNWPESWPDVWDKCIEVGGCEKVFNTVRPPSVSAGVDVAYMTCAPGYIMWLATEEGTEEVTMVAVWLAVGREERSDSMIYIACWSRSHKNSIFMKYQKRRRKYDWSLGCSRCFEDWDGPGWLVTVEASHHLVHTHGNSNWYFPFQLKKHESSRMQTQHSLLKT